LTFSYIASVELVDIKLVFEVKAGFRTYFI